jgi:transposase
MCKPLTKKELSKKYMVSYNTFIKWLKNVPELKLYANQRTLTPKQIEIIYNELGKP